jgi:hypothetical protein
MHVWLLGCEADKQTGRQSQEVSIQVCFQSLAAELGNSIWMHGIVLPPRHDNYSGDLVHSPWPYKHRFLPRCGLGYPCAQQCQLNAHNSQQVMSAVTTPVETADIR